MEQGNAYMSQDNPYLLKTIAMVKKNGFKDAL